LAFVAGELDKMTMRNLATALLAASLVGLAAPAAAQPTTTPDCDPNAWPNVCVTADVPHVRRVYNPETNTCTVFLDLDGDGQRGLGEIGATSALFCRIDAEVFAILAYEPV
jgi:hypothetical protein